MPKVRSKRTELAKAVDNLAKAYMLLYFNVFLGGTVDLLPDWLGYFFILLTIKGIEQEEETASLLRPLAWGLFAWELIDWVLQIFPIISLPEGITLLKSLVTIFGLYLHFQLLTNVANVAEKYHFPKVKNLLRLRTVNTILITCTLFVGLSEETVLIGALLFAEIFVYFWIFHILKDVAWHLERGRA